MLCYLSAALTGCVEGSAALKRQGRKLVPSAGLIVHLPRFFLRKLVGVVLLRGQTQSFTNQVIVMLVTGVSKKK